jgi:hypothetical protein
VAVIVPCRVVGDRVVDGESYGNLGIAIAV